MLILKTKWFKKWAKKNAVGDKSLKETIENKKYIELEKQGNFISLKV